MKSGGKMGNATASCWEARWCHAAVRAELVESGVPPVCDSGRRPRAVEASSGNAGIGAGIHYPSRCTCKRPMRRATTKGRLPVTERLLPRFFPSPCFRPDRRNAGARCRKDGGMRFAPGCRRQLNVHSISTKMEPELSAPAQESHGGERRSAEPRSSRKVWIDWKTLRTCHFSLHHQGTGKAGLRSGADGARLFSGLRVGGHGGLQVQNDWTSLRQASPG